MRPNILQVGGTLYWVLQTRDPDTMVLKDADSTPTVAVRKNGSSVGDSVTITKRSATTGIYDCSYNPAAEVEGDSFTLEESATVTGTTTGSATYTQTWCCRVAAIERGTDSAALASGVNVTQFGGANGTFASGVPEVKVASMASNSLNAAAISADAGAELAALVETYIVNEGDATAVMQAIADKIAADWVAGDASPLAIASAVWASATRTITGGTLTTSPPTTAEILTALGTGSWATSLASQTSVTQIVNALPSSGHLAGSADANGAAALNTAARVKLDADQPDYVPATAAALATTYALLQLTDTDVAAMEARLPSDPADQSAVEAAITVVNTKIGTPAGASVSADIAAVKSDTGTLLSRVTTTVVTLWANLTAMITGSGASAKYTTGSLSNAPGGSGGAGTESDLMVSTTIATLTSQTVFTLTEGSADNDAYNDQLVVLTDASTSTQKWRGIVSDYVGSTKTVTLRAAPGFTIAAGDAISIIAIGSDVSSTQLAGAVSSAIATAGVSTTVTGIPTFLRVGDARTVANGGAISVRLYDADDDSLLFGLGTQLFADATITFSLRSPGNDGTEGTEEAVIPCTWVASGGDGYVQIAYEADALDDCDAMDKVKEKDCHRWGIKFQWGSDDPITPVYGTVSVLRKIVSTQ